MLMKFRAVELNRLDEETIANIRIWRNQDFVRKNMFSTHIITEEEHKKYIEKIKTDPNRGLFVYYLDGEPFGVAAYEMDLKRLMVTGGAYLINEEYQALGYGMILYYMANVIEYFHLGAKREYAEVIDVNKKALSLLYQRGFVLEKTRKDCVMIDGVSHDVYCLSGQILMPDENSKATKLVRRLIEQEPMEDMLIL